MSVRLLACVVLLVPTAFGGWPRYLDGNGKGSYKDSPPSHPLAYFRADPCLRPNSDSLVSDMECTWEARSPQHEEARSRWAKTQTDLVEVGKMGTFAIYDLRYQREGGNFYPDFDLRSVLVKTGADQYREIDVSFRRGSLLPASEIIDLDGEPILIAKSHDGRNNNRIQENLYMFRPSGLETPDFKAVGDAVKKLMPRNMSIRVWTHDYAGMTELVEGYRDDLNLPPVSVTERCRISISYRFVDGHAVVTGSKYEPYSQ